MPVLTFFRKPGLSKGHHNVTLNKLQALAKQQRVKALDTEICFYVLVDKEDLAAADLKKLIWLLATPFQESQLSRNSHICKSASNQNEVIIEIGPRLNFSTAFSTNAVSMCHSVGLTQVTRVEYSTRYAITLDLEHTGDGDRLHLIAPELESAFVNALHDKMTQCRYLNQIENFDLDVTPASVFEVDVMNGGRQALEEANKELGLAFDDWDLDYYTTMFKDKIKRNPTNVECFDLAQSNSEHSRHWFFKGRMVVDGKEYEASLFKMVMETQKHSNQNNVIKFSDNSSAIEGHTVKLLYPVDPSQPSSFVEKDDITRHIILTAETHNFPTGVAPFPGATTGTGGRIRDVHATGRGAHVVAGTAGYCFGNLHIPDYPLPWEDTSYHYPSNFASPLEIAIEASNGASDYGNKFGEPVLAGFARSFGATLSDGRREWVKPIMFSAGIGSMDHLHVKKDVPECGMEVVKLGGPVYRIGVGGGAASSIQVQGDNTADLDFGAVQRGDAEMEQKLNRVIRACIEHGDSNPIRSIHDQGAGGNGNVLKEIVEPAGAIIYADNFQLGDPTISILELWGAEYQESNAILVRAKDSGLLRRICEREKCPVAFVGKVTGDGKIRLENFSASENNGAPTAKKRKTDVQFPVDLDLETVLGSMPRKAFNLTRSTCCLTPLKLPENLQLREALERVLRLPSVASKRYLTNKVDRSVTGLVAQQQCVGPLHTPLADVAVTALSYFDTVGMATAIGEQPIKGLVDPKCGARMTVGEALTNLVFARVSDLKDVKCSANWMWPAKLPGEGAALFDTCKAMCDVMQELGIAVDGGKDSLSMAARVEEETVKAPGTLVVSTYAACPDITATVTPDLKCPGGKGLLLWVDFSLGQSRLGGSALAQCYKQIGDKCPDLEDSEVFSKGFRTVQSLISDGLILSGHDISDGGLITCVLEMAFAGNCGIDIDIPAQNGGSPTEVLFAEELGLVLEVLPDSLSQVKSAFEDAGIGSHLKVIGHSTGPGKDSLVNVAVNGTTVLEDKMSTLRDIWEETSFQLEHIQTNPVCATMEQEGLKDRTAPTYKLSFDPNVSPLQSVVNGSAPHSQEEPKPKVAIIREEGSNGDREMVAALHMAGFEVWDVNMQDLCRGSVTLGQFRGVVFVGGFSYADVLGSAKGWAATLLFNEQARAQFDQFKAREDTFSLGVCNGCQLMALLGWVAPDTANPVAQSPTQGIFLEHNLSERFESRFPTVCIDDSPSIMLKDMAGSQLGIWIAHGEGRMVFKNDQILRELKADNLVPIKFVDDDGNPTTQYPHNPNGSPEGICALCSKDGRHLAMMPHPERCVLPWQWPWMPEAFKTLTTSPWLRMFQNAYIWCREN